jgi:hypothetical protein
LLILAVPLRYNTIRRHNAGLVQTNNGRQMKAKKRAPGGGRKPQGRITGKSAAFTTRITPETRKALEDACGPGKSLSQVAEEMLRAGLMARERADDPARAICYLIAELAKCCGAEDAGQRRGPDRIATDKFAAHEDESQRSDKIFDHDTREYNPMPVREPEPKFDWVTDPFSFRAFKLAVGQLLDLLEPQGEIISTVDRLGEDVFRGARGPCTSCNYVNLVENADASN